MVVKTLTRLFALLAALCIPVIALAQVAASGAVDPVAPLATGDALTELVKLLGTLKGASAIGIAFVVVQGCMLALRTPLADKLGKWKLTALLALSCVVSLLAAKVAGATWGAAFMSGPLLAAGQNFGHQLFSQFTEKPDTSPGAEH